MNGIQEVMGSTPTVSIVKGPYLRAFFFFIMRRKKAMPEELKAIVYEANMLLPKYGLVTFTCKHGPNAYYGQKK